MQIATRSTAFLAAAVLLAACGDQQPTGVAAGPRASLGLGAAAPCAASPTRVAGSEAELRAALDSARAGDVIAVAGLVPVAGVLEVRAPGVTLTCAAPGDGLRAVNPPDSGAVRAINLLHVQASDVTVRGLVLDGEVLGQTPLLALAPGGRALRNVRLLDSDLRCGAAACAFFVGVAEARVEGNRMHSPGLGSGLQMQGGGPRDAAGEFVNATSGSVVERNVVTAAAGPFTGTGGIGGIRVRDGVDLVVRHNEVSGPFISSIAVSQMDRSLVEQNRLSGARRFGIFVGINPLTPVSVRNTVFRGNLISESAAAGIEVLRACGNTFAGNELRGNMFRAFNFQPTSGANRYLGNGELVVDNGRMDCDGDGAPDPNLVSGGDVTTTPDDPGPETLGGPAAADAPAAL